MAPQKQQNAKPDTWETMDLSNYSNVHFTDSTVPGASSAQVKHTNGSFLEFISPPITTFGISELNTEGKLSYSLSHVFSADDNEQVKAYRAFLERLTGHMMGFCDPESKKPDPLVVFPKKKDSSGVYVKKGISFVRDFTKNPTVRYKIYPEKDKNKFETGLLGVRLYNKKGEPLFDYKDKESQAFFKDREPPMERTMANEIAAIRLGCLCRVMCSARVSSTMNGGSFWLVLIATKIKHIRDGTMRESKGGADFGDDDDVEEEENEHENENDKATATAAVSSGSSRKRKVEEDDGVEDEVVDEVVAEPAKEAEAEVEVADDEEVPVVAVAPPLPQLKKRKLGVPKRVE